jgi:hypothetical protein
MERSFRALDIQSIYKNRCETRDMRATCGHPNLYIRTTKVLENLQIMHPHHNEGNFVSDFYIHGSAHRHSILIRTNKMQLMQVFICCKITLHVLGVYRTHHQEYIKLSLQLQVQVISRIRAKIFCQRGLIRPRWLKVVALTL